jgi:hypothetical protein
VSGGGAGPPVLGTPLTADQERRARRERIRLLAEEVWTGSRRGRIPLTSEQRDVMYSAYHLGVLPRDRDHGLGQWVEDNCPVIV